MSVVGMLMTLRHGVDYNNTSPGYPQADKGGIYVSAIGILPFSSCCHATDGEDGGMLLRHD